MAILQRMTYADFRALPEDGMLHELVRGEIGEDVLPGFSLNLGELFG